MTPEVSLNPIDSVLALRCFQNLSTNIVVRLRLDQRDQNKDTQAAQP